jgi:hypothetical protein
MTGECGRAPSELHRGICLTTDEDYGKLSQGSRVVKRLLVAADLNSQWKSLTRVLHLFQKAFYSFGARQGDLEASSLAAQGRGQPRSFQNIR